MALSTFSTMNTNWPFNPCDHVHNTHNLLTPRAMPTRGGGEQSERHASIDLNDKGSLLQNKKHYFFHHDISTKHKNMTFLLSYNTLQQEVRGQLMRKKRQASRAANRIAKAPAAWAPA